ncbi:MAG: hypothetical protein U0840_20230 [Gemmataceae bacterium]
MNLLKRNWVRPLIERLEDRTVPTFSATSIVADASGNFTASIVTNQAQLDIDYDGATATLTIDDATSTPLIVSGVTGNVNITLGTTVAAASAFEAEVGLDGVLAGNFSLTVNRASAVATATANIDIVNAAASSVLGNLNLTTNSASGSTIDISPGGGLLTVVGSVSVTTLGGGAAAPKAVTVPASNLSVGGNLTVRQVNDLDIGGGNTVTGTLNLTTRASSLVANANTIGISGGTVIGNLSITLGNVSGTGDSDVTLANQVNGFTSIAMGSNTGAQTTNTLTLNGFISVGSIVSITGKNGSKLITFNNVDAGLARLTVSLGNATDNDVVFTGTNTFAYTTLVGGTGTNTVTGTIPSPFRLIRFSF